MHFQEFTGINSFLVGISKLLLEKGVKRNVRGFITYEINNPIIIKISNPLARIVTIPEREWNHVLPYAESLWLASGRNDMKMIGTYLKKMYDFSDDNESMRAGYGPRLRFFNGISKDYKSNYLNKNISDVSNSIIEVDQFDYIVKAFEKDPYTRQAIISITDPAKDYIQKSGILKSTKDFPCTNNIQFLRRGNCLDVITHMRSNDFVWGASGVNIFNFTFMQEYFAKILNLEIGHYYHIVNNLHYYDNLRKKVELIANVKSYSDDFFSYSNSITNFREFSNKLLLLENFEQGLREKTNSILIDFEDDFFNDWAKVFYLFYTKDNLIDFCNPILNRVYKKRNKNNL